MRNAPKKNFRVELGLGRLTSVGINGTKSYNYTYEDNGNINKNSKVGGYDYVYDTDKPHAVVGVQDENGALPTSQCDVTYNSRNRAATISENGWSMELSYGGGLQREKSVLRNGNAPVCTTYFISKDCEYEIKTAYSRYIDYIYAEGKIVALHVHNITANADSLYYVQSDLLGSWDRIVDGSKQVVQSSHFDPWGNRMSASNWTLAQDGTGFAFRRGFTGHEHYDRFGVINMNARLYDPVLGRFFSPDPQVQSPFSTQGFNRYSYCGNNPVMCIDEDGESVLGIVLSVLAGAYFGGTCANNTTNPADWDWSSGKTWEYVVGGAILGGLSYYVGAAVAASGVPMANTLGFAYSSFYYSCGMSALTEGQIPVTMSMGVIGYNFDGHSRGYPFKKGNKWYQDLGYFFGALANLPDLVTLIFGNGQAIDVNTEKFIGYDEEGDKVDWWSHESITHNGETVVSVGPLGDGVDKYASLWDQLRNFKANKKYGNGYGAPGTWTISINNVSRNVLDWYNSNVSTWNLLFKSCVGHSTWALFMAGVPTIYLFHPVMLNSQLLIRQIGITLSPYLQTQID